MTQLNPENDRKLSGDEVVISGMSGLYPEAHNLKELSEILYNKVNPVNDENCRWDYTHPEGTCLMGKVPEIDFFDSQFFNVHYGLSHAMDPMARKMYEHTFQAIYDAGINPQHLKGKKVAVFVAAAISESEGTCIYKYMPKSRYGLMGSCRTMFANRISYWLETIGPSVAVNEACCGSIRALEQAYQAIKSGECEAAIVGASNLRLLPHACIHYKRLIDINNDGKTKSFDQNADGCNLSDAINVLFLQKAKHALRDWVKVIVGSDLRPQVISRPREESLYWTLIRQSVRVYAEVKHVKCEFLRLMVENMSLHYELRRKPGAVTEFLEQFYEEAQVSPQAVEYVEALGFATPYLDKMELEAFENVFTENRSDPLYVGSVTSNIGFTEGASGISVIHKVLLGYEKGTMAANLNYLSPRQDIKAIRQGAIQIVSEHQRVKRTYAAVNGVSVNGSNSHVLLEGHYKQKDLSAYKSPIPYMALISGRKESGVDKIKEELRSHPVDQEELALLHHIHSMNISGHLARGYVILDEVRTKAFSLAEKSAYYDDTKRPLWFVVSGMGSQWPGMGTQLMRIPMFAASIERLQRVLEPKGVDLINIITSKDEVFSNVFLGFVGIVAIQIGLTDILTELGLKPDGIIGHSTGELVCAYIDGCLTAEETILGAYYRGLVSIETPLIRGAMAAVGLGYKEISRLCPPDITVACHNGSNSSTISGPIDQMKDFVAALTAKGIFAKSVPCGNIAYHSQYIRDAVPGLIKYMSQVIKKPKLRSKRWVSTSVEKNKLNEFNSKYCTAEYFTNNFVNPVLFVESLQQVPQNAVLVEIAPHGLLQAILKRSLHNDCRIIALTRRQYPDNVLYLLQAIGNLYVLGYNPKIEVLYPKVQFPVSTGTPMLSHLIEWVHEEKWKHLSFSDTDMIPAMANNFVISYQDDEYSYLRGHVIRGATVFPFAAALTAAWDILLMSSDIEKRTKSVEFRNLQLFVQPLLLEHRPTRLTVAINKGSGWFEITEEQFKYKVVTGYITSKLTESFEKDLEMYDNYEVMSGKDIYQLLQDRDYSYSGEFRSIQKANADLSQAELGWCNNWVTLIDGMLQLNALRQPHHAVSLPTYIRKMSIDVEKHMHIEKNCLNGKTILKAMIFDDYDFSRCGGLTIHNIKFRNLPPWKPDELKIKVSKLPYSTNSEQETHCNSEAQQKLLPTEMPVLALKCKEFGNLDSCQWVESSTKLSGVPVNVHYVGLNKYDVNKAIGATVSESSNVSYGMDFSGTLKSGERVMGIVKSGAASTMVMAQPELVWPVPEHWSLEDAATVPLAYAQALYLLKIKVRLNPGMTVFIEGGAGALGQAVISIALASQCRVFTSVSDFNKKQLLLKIFPQLKDEFIFNSRHFTYVDDLNIATNGRCDVIISYSKGLLKNLLLKSVAGDGTFLDLVQVFDREDFVFGMNHLTKARSYAAVDLSSIFSHHQTEMQTLQELLANGIIHGYVRPLSRVTYASHEAARAFKLLMARKSCGRVLLRMEDNLKSQAIRSVVCAPDACQLILIDDQILSMRLAEKLVAQGARSLYIACDKVTPFHLFKTRTWNHKGIKVNFFNKKLGNSQDITSLLKSATNIGPVEGIYLSLTERRDKCTSESDIINYVDSTSRYLCPKLKYFVVLTTNGIEAKNIYLSRTKRNLPITILDFLALTEVKDYYLTLIDVVEQALGSTQIAKVIQIDHIQKCSILNQLNSITDLNLHKQNGNKTLAEIGVKNNKIPTIQSLLRDTYNKFLNDEEVHSLTINELTKLNDILEGTIKSLQGLQNLFSHVGSDEHLATAPLVSLPTLAKNITEMNKIEIVQTYFYIIPGTEGLYERFRELCERLQLPAVVLQPGLEHPHETIQQTAKRYSQVILNASKCLDNFYLLGYGSGVLVALEVAAILENQGFTGTVFCLGFAPDEFQIEFEKILSEFETENDLQDSILRHIFTLLTGKDTMQLEKALQGTSTWKQKVDVSIRCLLGRKTQSTQFVRAFIEATLARIEQVRRYSVTPFQLQSRLVLLRAATKHVVPSQSALQQFSSQPVDVYQLRLPLAHAQNDTLIAPIVNKYLSSEILNSFKVKNVCNVYVNTTVLDPFLI